MKAKHPSILILFSSILLFVLALVFKTYCTGNTCQSGFVCLLMGPLGMLYGGAGLTWLANPFLFVSWFFIKKRPVISCVLGLVSTLIALSFLMFNSIIVSEAGNYADITHYGLGYWLWVSSSTVVLIGNSLAIFSTFKHKSKG